MQETSVKAGGKRTFSSETSVDFQRTTGRYTPEDITLNNHRRENLISYIGYTWFSPVTPTWSVGHFCFLI
jgi:hypothetical protein